MAKIKRTFQRGKMNKDLDERLIPQGEYRDALNIEVSTSDGSDVGVAQSVRGNNKIPSHDEVNDPLEYESTESLQDYVTDKFPGAKVVGSVSDDKTNSCYFFIAAPGMKYYNVVGDVGSEDLYPKVRKDLIVRYDSSDKKIYPVFTDVWSVDILDTSVQTLYNDFNYITFKPDNNDFDLIRPGMTVKGTTSNALEVVTQFADDYQNTNALANQCKVTHVNRNTRRVYLDRKLKHTALGDPNALLQTQLVAWRFNHPEPVLQFSEGLKNNRDYDINAINVIDNLIFWTDGISEPKKINIDRLINGTGDKAPGFSKHSLNLFRDPYSSNPNDLKTLSELEDPDNLGKIIDNGFRREHITVIKKSPTTAPKLIMSNSGSSMENVATQATCTFDFFALGEDDEVSGIQISQDFSIGSTLVFTPLINKYLSVRAVVTDVSNSIHTITIESISDSIRFGSQADFLNYNVSLVQPDSIFKDKIGRFAYRYKYYDGECSTFSPWSELAFIPSKYDYTPKKGYNLGMVNNIRSLSIVDFVNNYAARPDDVKEIDILFKDTSSPNVYVVKTVKRNKHFEWHNTLSVSSGHKGSGGKGVVNISTDMIHRVLESSQMLRAWDNVPKTAKAQEVTGNRIVYANYTQGYDIISDIIVDANVISSEHPSISDPSKTSLPYKSLKSMRKYKLGVVFGDEYGRETPVIGVSGAFNNYSIDPTTGESSLSPDNYVPESFSVKKEKSSSINKIRANINWGNSLPEDWMKYYKFYIKETSNEYYNLVMDKWYDNKDDTIWISFPSADRNKVDEETYLILKKAHRSNEPIFSEDARYKILSISNEAPPSIRRTDKIIGSAPLDSFIGGLALSESLTATASGGDWMSSGIGPYGTGDKTFKGIAWARIKGVSSGATPSEVLYSDWVRVSNVSIGGTITVVEPWGVKADMNSDYGFGASASVDLFIELKDSVVEDRPEFNGRFFVKIFKDNILEEEVAIAGSNSDIVYVNKSVLSLGHIFTGGLDQELSNPADADAAFKGDYSTIDTPTVNNGVDDQTNYIWAHSNFQTYNENPVNMYHAGDTGPLCENSSGYNWQAIADYWDDYLNSSTYTSNQTDRLFIDNADYVFPGPAVSLASTGETLEAGSYMESGFKKGLFAIGAGDVSDLEDAGYVMNATTNAAGDILSPSGKNAIQISALCSTISNGTPAISLQAEENMQLFRTIGQRFRFKGDPGLNGDPLVYEVFGYSPMELVRNYKGRSTAFEDNDCISCLWQIVPTCTRKTFTILFRRVDNAYLGLETSVWDPRSSVRHDGQDSLEIELLELTDTSQYLPFNSNMGNAIWETEPKEDIGLDLYYEASEAIPIKLNSETIEDYIPLYSKVIYGNYPENIFVNSARRDVISLGYEEGENNSLPIGIGSNLRFERPDGTITQSKVIDYWGASGTYSQDLEYAPGTKHTVELLIYDEDSDGNFKLLIPDEYSTGTPSGVVEQLVSSFSSSNNFIWHLTKESGPATIDFPSSCYVVGLSSGSMNNYYQLDVRFVSPNTLSLNDNTSWTNALDLGNGGFQTFTACLQKVTGFYRLRERTHANSIELPWFNCYSFGNGLESNRIKDDFNAPYINNGVKVSTTLEDYGEELRSNGLIHSGIYNSTSGINELNQFNMAEPITKDVNPSHGPIMALKSRDTNLITFCEDKVLKILANKDALFNADGSSNLTSTNVVLGNSIAYAGDYGISSNPESLAVDGYRMYFVDNHRNKVLRLSQDGLTVISDIGMKSWFRDNLTGANKLVGSFDEVKGDYNLSIIYNQEDSRSNTTLSFNERNKGWTSFKSFVQESGISINSDYLTANEGYIWLHHIVPNTSEGGIRCGQFYGVDPVESSLTVIFNEQPSVVKDFKAIEYEGSKAKIKQFTSSTVQDVNGNIISSSGLNSVVGDGEYYNLKEDTGWYLNYVQTDLGSANAIDFKNKEGKWFTNLIGDQIKDDLSNLDLSNLSIQGVGVAKSIQQQPIYGCTNTCADNYNPLATVDDGTCFDTDVYGCMDSLYQNYNASATVNQVSCTDTTNPCGAIQVIGCNINLGNYNFTEAVNHNPNVTQDDGSCVEAVYGCMNPISSNYNYNANVDDGSCDEIVLGCMDVNASNYNELATHNAEQITLTNSLYGNPCEYEGCTDEIALNYIGIQDDGTVLPLETVKANLSVNHNVSGLIMAFEPILLDEVESCQCCEYPVEGCTDPGADNYNAAAAIDDGSCTYLNTQDGVNIYIDEV